MKKYHRESRRRGVSYIVITRRKADVIGRILHRNFLVKHVIEAKIEVTRRRERIRKQLLDEFKEKRGYCELKEEALNGSQRSARMEQGVDLSQERLCSE
jgi:hypothetical protein